jgi:hypothetical protein
VQPSDYVKAAAIVTNVSIKMSIRFSWPHLEEKDREVMLIDVIDRMARLHGWSLRREPVLAEEDSGE